MNNEEYTIFVVEDDYKLRTTINDYLSESGFNVICESDGKRAVELFYAQIQNIDLVLLDGMLPSMDGFDVLKMIRKISNVPIIITSARESESDQLKGFSSGADNYLTKPFMLSVLKQHILKLLERCAVSQDERLSKGALLLDKDGMRMYLNGKYIETTPKEFEVLYFLASNEKKVFDRNKILNAVWGNDYYGDLRTVDTVIKQLRKKLTDDYKYIISVYGVGYYFEA